MDSINFIRLRDGVVVRKDAIDVVERTDDLKCDVTVGLTVYKCELPYTALISLLEMQPVADLKIPAVSPMGQGQYFAG